MGVCIVLNFNTAEVHVHPMDDTLQSEDVEEILTEQYDYKLSEIEFMITDKLRLTIHDEVGLTIDELCKEE